MAALSSRFRFGSFELDGSSNELRKNGLRIGIEEQPFRILWMLVSRQSDLVTREELKEALWADDTHVDFDRSLNRAVNKVRLALGDSASNPRFIETLSRRGYRFVAPVTIIEEPREPSQETSEPSGSSAVRDTSPKAPLSPGLRRWAALAAALALVAVSWVVFFRQNPAKHISSVAVLPLENVSDHPEERYFSDGMTDQLIAVLSRLPSLRVVSLKSVMRYKGTHKKLAEIANELNVEGIVDGSVARVGERVRINARLVQFPGEQAVWTKTYERSAAEVLSLQNELARSIAAEIGRSIRPEEEKRLASSARPVDPQLQALFLRGRFFANEPGREALERAIGIMEKVVKEDPGHAAAYSAAADAWFGMASVYIHPVLAMPKAKAAARKAIDLDPQSDAARAVLGRVHLFYDWDWQAADEQFQKAIELNPNSSEAHRGLACLKLVKGQDSEAMESANRAVQLDPRSLWAQHQMVLVHTFAQKYDIAIRHARSTLEWEPGFGVLRSLLGMAYLEKHQLPEALRELESAARSQRVPTTLGFLACGYASAGRKSDADRILTELVALSNRQYVCPFEVAVAFAALGRHDDAFTWMNKGVADRADCMLFLRSEPWLRPFRSDARYAGLVRSVGFPEPSVSQ